MSALYENVVKMYFEFAEEQIGIEPKFGAIDGKKLKELIKYFQKAVTRKRGEEATDDDVLACFDAIFSRWDTLSDHLQKQLKPQQIDSNIVNILGEIKQHERRKQAKGASLHFKRKVYQGLLGRALSEGDFNHTKSLQSAGS